MRRAVPWAWALPPAVFVKSKAGARKRGVEALTLANYCSLPDFVATNNYWAVRNNRENFSSLRDYLQRIFLEYFGRL